MQITNKQIKELIPYQNNPRRNDKAVDAVAASIKQFGFKQPIVIDKDNVIVCGHTRYKAAQKLRLKEVPCIMADDLTDDQIKAFRLADNKTAELAEWDFPLLDLELADIDLDMSEFGFDFEIDNESTPTEREDLSSAIGAEYQIIIDCKDEMEQEELYNRFTEEGLQCRVLTL